MQSFLKKIGLFFVAIAFIFSFQNCSNNYIHLNVLNSASVAATDVLLENEKAEVLNLDVVDGIHPGEIFQRKDDGQATILLNLNRDVLANLSSYSISLLTHEKDVKEKTLVTGAISAKTSFTFNMETGMTARRVRLSFHDKQGVEQLRWQSPSFSVGEVFLVAGQSNSSNHGETLTASSNILNRSVDPTVKSWVPMADPLPYGTNFSMPPWNGSFTGGSPWPSFADNLSSQLQVPVAVISLGVGGSSVASWAPGAYENNFERLRVGLSSIPSCGFRAVLWHQGETDSLVKNSSDAYQSSFRAVVNAFRSSSGCQQPWMIARASYLDKKSFGDGSGNAEAEAIKWASEVEVRKAQNALAISPGFLIGPDTDLVIAPKYRYDGVHFSTLGLALHGKLWAQRILGFLGSPFLVEKDLVPEVAAIWNSYKINGRRSDVEIAADPEGLRYWVGILSAGKATQMQIDANLLSSNKNFIEPH